MVELGMVEVVEGMVVVVGAVEVVDDELVVEVVATGGLGAGLGLLVFSPK